jgi:hypothetical protein
MLHFQSVFGHSFNLFHNAVAVRRTHCSVRRMSTSSAVDQINAIVHTLVSHLVGVLPRMR